MPITVFTKSNCQQCNATKRSLKVRDLEFTEVDIETNPSVMDELKAQGFLEAPVVDVDGARWSGFRPDLIRVINNE